MVCLHRTILKRHKKIKSSLLILSKNQNNKKTNKKQNSSCWSHDKLPVITKYCRKFCWWFVVKM